MKTKALLNVLLFGGLAAVAGPDQKPADPVVVPKKAEAAPAATASKPAADFPIIGYLEKRGQVITIKSGPKGALYSVKTAAGKVLYENVSAEQLRAQAPELHEFLKGAVVGPGAVGDARVRVHKLDAGLGSR
jgi:hypothetical protein